MARTPKIVEDRRQQIMDAALRVFAQKGFEGATNKDIANEAGITPGLIYHYFDNKEALLKAVIEDRSPAQTVLALSSESMAQSPEDLLRLVIHRTLTVAESESFLRLIRIFLTESIRNPEIAPLALASLAEETQMLEDYLSAKMTSGELRQADPSLIAQVLLASIMGLIVRRRIANDPAALQYTREQIAEGIVTLVTQGLFPR